MSWKRELLLVCAVVLLLNLSITVQGGFYGASTSYFEELTSLFPRVSVPEKHAGLTRGREHQEAMVLVRSYNSAREAFLDAYFLRPDHPDLFAEIIHVYLRPALSAFRAEDYDGARRTWNQARDRLSRYRSTHDRSVGNKSSAWTTYNVLLPMRDEYSMSVFDEARSLLNGGDSLFAAGQFATANVQYRQAERLLYQWYRRIAADEIRARLMVGYASRRLAEVEQLRRATDFYPDFMNRNRGYLREIDRLLTSGRWHSAMTRSVNLLENLEAVSHRSDEMYYLDLLAKRVETLINQCRQNNAEAMFGDEFESIVVDHNARMRTYVQDYQRVSNNMRADLTRLLRHKGHLMHSIAHLEDIRNHSQRRTSREIMAFREPVIEALRDHLMVAFFPIDVKSGRIKLAELEATRMTTQAEFEAVADEYQRMYQELEPLQNRLKKLKTARDQVEELYKYADHDVMRKADSAAWQSFSSARNSGNRSWQSYNFMDADRAYQSAAGYVEKFSKIHEGTRPRIVRTADEVVGRVEYKVKPGDSMWNIARRLYGDPTLYIELVSWNDRVKERGDPWPLVVGETLLLYESFTVRNQQHTLRTDKLQ